MVEDFVVRTGIDSLAISIGTVHEINKAATQAGGVHKLIFDNTWGLHDRL